MRERFSFPFSPDTLNLGMVVVDVEPGKSKSIRLIVHGILLILSSLLNKDKLSLAKPAMNIPPPGYNTFFTLK